MFFSKEYKNRFELEFGSSDKKINGMKIKKWLYNNSDIEIYLKNILKNEPRFGNFGNVLWAMRNDFDIDNYKCKSCGKLLKMIHATQLHYYCSCKCAMSSEEIIDKRNNTISKDDSYYIRRQENIRKTNLERYGVDIPAKSKEIVKKMKETFSKTPNIWNNRNEKSKQTCLEHYGVENPYNQEYIKEKSKRTHRLQSYKSFEKFKDIAIPLFSFEEYFENCDKELKWKCCRCGKEFYQKYKINKSFNSLYYNMPRCFDCFPKNMSIFQKEILNFCKESFKNIISNDHKIINGLELDIVIPEINLAIECNGVYWHSKRGWHSRNNNDLISYKNYHLNKTKLCNEKGYRLIHIWEDEWTYNSEDVKKKLKDIFEGNENLNFSDDEIVLDRSWYNNVEIPGYILKEETEPEELTRLGEEVENCGYLIFKRV